MFGVLALIQVLELHTENKAWIGIERLDVEINKAIVELYEKYPGKPDCIEIKDIKIIPPADYYSSYYSSSPIAFIIYEIKENRQE